MQDAPVQAGIAGDAIAQRMLLAWLVRGEQLPRAVTATLEIVERDPLVASGCFRGALVRGLMEVPGAFWARQPQLYERYVRVLRASALARRGLSHRDRMEFWTPLDALPVHGTAGTVDTDQPAAGAAIETGA